LPASSGREYVPAGRWYTACDTCWLITDEMDEMDEMDGMDEMDDIFFLSCDVMWMYALDSCSS
jgi:hypothetical protein